MMEKRALNAYGWMVRHGFTDTTDVFDAKTGEYNATKLAEAYFLAHPDEDDGANNEGSSVWDDAVRAATYLEKAFKQ